MEQILINDGPNKYKLKHMGKDALRRWSELPVVISLSEEALAKINTAQPPTVEAEEVAAAAAEPNLTGMHAV